MKRLNCAMAIRTVMVVKAFWRLFRMWTRWLPKRFWACRWPIRWALTRRWSNWTAHRLRANWALMPFWVFRWLVHVRQLTIWACHCGVILAVRMPRRCQFRWWISSMVVHILTLLLLSRNLWSALSVHHRSVKDCVWELRFSMPWRRCCMIVVWVRL